MECKLNIIAISGKQYSGKDTACNVLLKFMPDYRRIGIGDAIKLELAKKKNIAVDEIYNNKHLYREELIELGNWGRSVNPDYWLKNLLGYNNIIVPDLRVIHELEFFKSRGAVLIRVEASLETRKQRGNIVGSNDITETGLDDYTGWDYIIENNGTYEELEKRVEPVAKAILRKNYL